MQAACRALAAAIAQQYRSSSWSEQAVYARCARVSRRSRAAELKLQNGFSRGCKWPNIPSNYPFLLECRFARVAGPRGATFGAGRFGGGARLLPFSRATSAFSFAISAAAARGSDPHTTSLHLVANWNELTDSATFAWAGELQTNIIVFAEPPTESDMSIVKGWFR